MSSPVAAAPLSGSTDRGGDDRGPGRGQSRRRARNRRYRRNRTQRSLLHIVGWNAEGLRTKVSELQSWLPSVNADVVAIQEAQFPTKTTVRIPGYQPPVVTRRTRGRQTGAASAKGGDVAIYVRGGLTFSTLSDSYQAPADDTTEICGVRIHGKFQTDIINVYRPPIRRTRDDDRTDNFDPGALPSGDNTIILGDFNGHHPSWDYECDAADEVGNRLAEWLDREDWLPLNTGEPTHTSYRSGCNTAPDVACCSRTLARRTRWSVGPDLGSDHLPMLLTVRSTPAAQRTRRKAKWAFQKADWVAFRADCEDALCRAVPQRATAQELTTRFTEAVMSASRRHIPRGARPDAKPWALDPELQQAVSDRQEARRQIRADDPASRERWIAAKRRAADVERSATQAHFRIFVEDNLNQPASLGRVTKILKKWEGAGDEHQPGQAMRVGGRLLVTDREKAQAFCATYAHVSRQVRSAKVDRACKRRLQELRTLRCLACENRRTGCCSEFTEDELVQQLRHLQQKKAPGPDGVSNEHLQHLGPIARRALLELINASWMEGAVPREWRRARIVPIPKAGKDRRDVGSYRPIALTSHLSKLVERLVLGRLRHIVERDRLVPAEQVGFRAGRSVEDSIGRLVQQVQDGWNLPKSRSKRVADGTTAQKYVLLAFDFARAYDTVDHRLLRVRLMEMGVPRCLYNWTWQFLRDRRATVEYQSATSGERVFRAGLPQGSVLSPALFLLWAAPLAAELQRVPGTTAFLYADDTAALCADNDIQVARQRAQQAADTLAQWAQANKMTVAGQKTQALVLSQWPRDAANCSVKVAGETVTAGDQLKLLGVTLDRLLHFGPHCRSLRQRVRPRTAHLRKLTGREWGLQEQQLRVVASGYVRGALEHAAAARLPATSPTHLGLLEVEMRAAARVVTGCPRSTPAHGLMAEAGLAPVAERRTALAARLLAKARALPEDDPLRTVADREVRSRLSTVSGWRGVGEEAWREAGITPPISIEPLLPRPAAPWEPPPPVSFCLDVGAALPPSATDEQRRDAASHHLAGLPQCATWVWTDGSATEGVTNGGAGALIVWPDDETAEIRTPAGRICSSYRAEMVALRAALNHLLEHPAHTEDPVVICTDSQSALAALREGPAAQSSPLGSEIWDALRRLTTGGRRIHLQWVPSHCGLGGNEEADRLAGEAGALDQEDTMVDVRTIHRAAARDTREPAIEMDECHHVLNPPAAPPGSLQSIPEETAVDATASLSEPLAATELPRHAPFARRPVVSARPSPIV
ncbi:putative RNA-directed DNA polymerase from transposon BS [Amphibalanus amphitrite]|uniref:Putative RNA-directed DNA polymerase from transposon BS n=1 Tax=Amphibalanus amphitrite TaxID=1232801 RepID=A0A6A4VMS2_AMPAM|nr:putative RNA-directed DNA polymerase from transposon BS [Amphibalanus amphitrite]